MTQKLTVSALVRNRSGVLLRVAGLFARRGYNIRSLTVSETEHPEFSRMTVVSEVEPERIDAFIADMSVHGIAELSRSGITALESGDTVIND